MPKQKSNERPESGRLSIKRSSNSKFRKPQAISVQASYNDGPSTKSKPTSKMPVAGNKDLIEPLNKYKWPPEAIQMEQDANNVRKGALIASQLVRMGYSNDRKSLGEALLESDPKAKVQKFKIYGKNQIAEEFHTIVTQQRLAHAKKRVKGSDFGFRRTSDDFIKPLSPRSSYARQ